MQVRSSHQSSHSYPWWLLLFRLAMVTLLITGAASPTLNHQATVQSNGPYIIIVDDGWTAANDWTSRVEYMEELALQADRQGRGILLLTTSETATPPNPGIQSATDALETIRAMRPKPWQTDRSSVLKTLLAPELSLEKAGRIIWLGDGLQSGDGEFPGLLEALARFGPVTLVLPEPGNEAKALFPPFEEGEDFIIPVRRARPGKVDAVSIIAYDDNNRVIGQTVATFGEGDMISEADMDIPLEIRNRIELLRIEGERSAGAVVLLDERWRRRPVGLISTDSIGEDQPLLSGQYYLDRALQAVTDVQSGPVEDLLDRETAVMIMVDPAPLNKADHDDLVHWVERGGMLVIFAGPRIASLGPDRVSVSQPSAASTLTVESALNEEAKNPEISLQPDSEVQMLSLLPVKLRSGGRAIGGAMSWRRPASIAPFSEGSPFQGLIIPKDVRIKRQVLAVPSLDLEDITWASLTDGTPLVTARPREQGTVVLFHITANAEWSNLPLSGLFVDMLKRITEISRGVGTGGDSARGLMPPQRTLDGFGDLTTPPETAVTLSRGSFELSPPSPRHPPGFYGEKDSQRALNLSSHLAPLQAVGGIPDIIDRDIYTQSEERSLAQWFFLAAALMLGLDMVISLWMRGKGVTLSRASQASAAMLLATAVSVMPTQALAQDQTGTLIDNQIIEAANHTRIAYIVTGDPQTDAISRIGLTSLGDYMAQRTSVELAPPVGIDPETDELSVYPLIYWPITDTTAVPSALAAHRINTFMSNGGTILFDTQDPSGAGNPRQLRQFATVLDIPRLMPVPGNHVLTRAFYLLSEFPGRWAGSPVWVVPAEERINDGVSPVIAGGHHWTAAWATDANKQPLFAAIPGGERQREYAYRFGINLVMHVLTGNYKNDQVHLPTIMNRLGQ